MGVVYGRGEEFGVILKPAALDYCLESLGYEDYGGNSKMEK